MDIKLVSILVAVKNEARFIDEAVTSLIAQDYKDLEIVIVDDGSTDGTQELLSQYEGHRSVKIFYTSGIGKNRAFNLAFEESGGDLIGFFAGDDVMLPNSVSGRVEKIRKVEGDFLLLSKLKTLSEIKKLDGKILPKAIGIGNRSGGSMLFPRALFEKIYPLPEELPNEDLWLNIYCEMFDIPVIHFPEVTYLLRIHENNSFSNFPTFQKKSAAMNLREMASYYFLSRFKAQLNAEKVNTLNKNLALESLRYNGSVLSIIFFPGLPLGTKLRAIVFSNALFYNLRVKFGAVLSGWL